MKHYFVECKNTGHILPGSTNKDVDRHNRHFAEIYYTEKTAKRACRDIQRNFDAYHPGEYAFEVREVEIDFNAA